MTEAPETISRLSKEERLFRGVCATLEIVENGSEALSPKMAGIVRALLKKHRRADLPPKVRALVWCSFGLENWQAKTTLGDYCIQIAEAETTQVYDIWMCDQDSEDYPDEEPRGTLEAAKAAAQAHYEALVLGCLEGVE